MINRFIDKIFHKCKFTTVSTYSGVKGTLWIQECDCNKRREVLFDSCGNCINIKNTK